MLEAVTLIAARDYREVPWRNRRGVTQEIIADPTPDRFDWRLSRALIAVDGPFSEFPGCDRTLVLLDGAGLELVLPDRTVRLAERYDRADFAGEAAVEARLAGGAAVSVLNVMVDRARASAEIRLMSVGSAPAALPPAPLLAIHAAGGSAVLSRGPDEERLTLDEGDTLVDRSARAGWLRSGLTDIPAVVLVAAIRVLPNS